MMTKEEVFALAREAAFHTPVMEGELLRFAALIEEHLTWSDIHSCHPDCTKPACVSMRKAEAHAAAVEREACAKLAEEWQGPTKDRELHIAAAIRSRT